MRKIFKNFIALTLAFSTLLTLTACGKKKKDEQPTEEEKQDQKQEQSTPTHECVFSTSVITEYPSFGKDGSLIASCECGKTSEQAIFWKENVIFKSEDITIDEYDYTEEEIERILSFYKCAYFDNIAQMYGYDNRESISGLTNTNSYLNSVSKGQYTIAVNRYTGVMYYKNNTTDEVIASNPYVNVFSEGSALIAEASQLSVKYNDLSGNEYVLYSIEDAAGIHRIEVTEIENGLRVSYLLGDTNERYLAAVPMWIDPYEFEKDILRPMMNYLYEKMVELLGDEYALNYFEGNKKTYDVSTNTILETDEKFYVEEDVYADRFLHSTSLREFESNLQEMLSAYEKINRFAGVEAVEYGPKKREVNHILTEMMNLIMQYRAYNPSHPKFKPGNSTPQRVVDGYSMYELHNVNYDHMLEFAETIQKYCPDYTFEMILDDEAICEYSPVVNPSSAFKVDIEYTFNDDGSFSVNLISDSIIYNDVYFILQSVELMHDYGNGKITSGEHIFLPSEA